MKYIYTAILTPQDDGSYWVRVPDLPGCITVGADLYDALAMGMDAIAVWLASAEEDGAVIPEPSAPGTIQVSSPSCTTLLSADTEAYREAYPPCDTVLDEAAGQ